MTVARLRPSAENDLVERTRYYRTEAGVDIGARFFDAAITALHAMERAPRVGSSRLGKLCDIPGLRVRKVVGFPCGWYYFIGGDNLDVVRLLADAQDLPSILADTESP